MKDIVTTLATWLPVAVAAVLIVWIHVDSRKRQANRAKVQAWLKSDLTPRLRAASGGNVDVSTFVIEGMTIVVVGPSVDGPTLNGDKLP